MLGGQQWGASEQPEPVLVVTEQEWEQFVADLLLPITQFTSTQMMKHWQEHQRLVEQLAAWLAEKWEGA